MELDSLFLSFPRLNIMNCLSQNNKASFSTLQDFTGLTAGNLYSHCKILQNEGYIVKKKIQKDGKFVVEYQITTKGINDLKAYLDQIEQYIQELQFKLRGNFESLKYQLPSSVFISYKDPEGNKFGINKFE